MMMSAIIVVGYIGNGTGAVRSNNSEKYNSPILSAKFL